MLQSRHSHFLKRKYQIEKIDCPRAINRRYGITIAMRSSTRNLYMAGKYEGARQTIIMLTPQTSVAIEPTI
jgi:hypothetical protein